MEDKLYLVTYDALNEYEYPEDDLSFSDVFGVFSNANVASEKVYEFINELKTLATYKGLKCSIQEVEYNERNEKCIQFGISCERDYDISGFIFYIREVELDHAEATKVEEFNSLNWLRE